MCIYICISVAILAQGFLASSLGVDEELADIVSVAISCIHHIALCAVPPEAVGSSKPNNLSDTTVVT